MIIAVIPAYNEEYSIGNLILKTKKYVDKIIVIDDGSSDETSTYASLAGAEVVKFKQNMGLNHALKVGLEKALELDPDFVITLDGDFSQDPEDIPKLLAPLKKGDVDISISMSSDGFRAFSKKAVHTLVKHYKESEFTFDKNINVFGQKLIVKDTPGIQRRHTPLGRFEEHVVDKVKKLTTQKEIYNRKRKIQKGLSQIESYKLISETFLKFIPPALLSLIISVTIIIPATKIIDISLPYVLILVGAIMLIFILCWILLIILLDKIYEKTIYIEALDRRLDEVEMRQTK